MSRTSAKNRLFLLAAVILAGFALARAASAETLKAAIFAGGCFWCVESDFESVEGVRSVVSGFTGGTVVNPTYKQVSRGGTGHFEAALITYDADTVSYARLLSLFFRSIDPTDAGGQFCDRGHTYATAVFYGDASEQALAEQAKAAASRSLKAGIVTEILAAGPFYPAEAYHQDYYKSTERVLTRFGWIQKQDAYKRYRKGCGRDARVRELWGDQAVFAGH